MNQAEPQPPPDQPERRRRGQRARLRLGWPDGSAARRSGSQPDASQPAEEPSTGGPGADRPGPGQPGADRPSPDEPSPGQPTAAQPGADRPPASRPDDCAEPQEAEAATQEAEHPVVIGYDGSESSRHALAYAVGMARRLGRGLLVAYVAMPGVFCEPLTGQVIAPSRDTRETQRWLLAELDEICDRTGLDVRILTRQGSPARELAAVADEFSADALVIGAPTHLWHHLAGSVPGWLARHAHCPVIVVP
jgi:nucleotide-binding universal stress UspA family protein